jgi:hypothetical protein
MRIERIAARHGDSFRPLADLSPGKRNPHMEPRGQTYASTIKLATFDRSGTPVDGGAEGTGAGTRIVF